MVPIGHFSHNPPWMGGLELPLAKTNFHGPKPVRAIEVLLYINNLIINIRLAVLTFFEADFL